MHTLLFAAWEDNQGGQINLDVNKNFTLIYGGEGTAVQGDFAATGNTIMDGNKNTNYFANSSPMMLQEDPDLNQLSTSAFNQNSSSAPLKLPNFVKADQIVWAGLFWQGQIHADANTTSQVDSDIAGWNTVHLKTPDGNIHTITAPIGTNNEQHSTYRYTHLRGGQYRHYYSAYVEITDFIRNSGYTPEKNTFTVGNIMATDGADKVGYIYFNHINEPAGAWYDGLHMGHFGGWSLIVVYNVDPQTAMDHSDIIRYRNVSIYNGYDLFSFWTGHAGDPFETTVNITGFKTPSSGDISSKMLFFGGGGDYGMGSDTLAIEDGNNPGTFKDLTNNRNAGDNKFNGTYTNFDTDIIPGKTYFQGMDLDIYDSSDAMKHYQSETKIKFGVVQQDGYIDQVFPQVIGFSTELFFPKLCYDYDVRVGEHIKIPSKNREVATGAWGDLPLKINTMIRSMQADFSIVDSKFNIRTRPSMPSGENIDYISNSSYISPPDRNIYTPIDDIDSAIGQVGFGKHATAEYGGVIDSNESNYIKQSFSIPDSGFEGSFDIYINGNVQFNPTEPAIPFTLSTAAPIDSPNYLPRCDANPVYNPIWANFNIERTDSWDDGIKGIPKKQYPLYTQIAGRDFNVSVVSYQKDANGLFTQPLETNVTVEVEIIDAGLFENNASAGFDSTCENPDAIGDGAFVSFKDSNGRPQARVNLSIPDDIPNFDNDVALQSAAFRIWILAVKEHNSTTHRIIHHSCDQNDLNTSTPCFKNVYLENIKPYDTQPYCQYDCESNYDAKNCYKCLKDYFAIPICSRDNFAIRPESYRIAISDNDERSNRNSPKNKLTDNSRNHIKPTQRLAAQYKYIIDGNATLFNDQANTDGKRYAKGYFNGAFKKIPAMSDTELGSKTKNNTIAALEFNSSKTLCNNIKHRAVKLRFIDGMIEQNRTSSRSKNTFIHHHDAGDYAFWVIDSNWTKVDQATYRYKTPFGSCGLGRNASDPDCYDCDINNPSHSTPNPDGKLGCVINSNLDVIDINKKDNFVEIPLTFEPYSYDLSDINLTTPNDQNNFVYMNDVNTTNIINRAMAVRFRGDIIAVGKKGRRLSNYTDGCAANDVNFDLNFTALQCGAEVAIQSIRSTNNYKKIPFRINYVDSNDTSYIVDHNESNLSRPITVNASEFTQDKNGSALIKLYYNFQKRNDDPVNPIAVRFNTKMADSPDSNSSAHMTNNFIPKGKSDINTTVQFYYGRVAITPDPIVVPIADNNIVIAAYAEAYSDQNMVCNRLHDLNTSSAVSSSGWMINLAHQHPSDGTAALIDPQNVLIITNGNNIDLSQNPANVTLQIPPAQVRPYNTTLICNTNVWLDCRDTPSNWLGGGGWAGPGKTGLIIDTTANPDAYRGRESW